MGFSKFSNKFPKHLNNKERRSYHSNHISNINYLDKHGFLRIFFHKHQGDKYGIKHMQANRRKHVEQKDTLIHFEFDFNDLELRFIQTHESNRIERKNVHKPSLLKRMGIKAVVTQPNQRWLAEFGVIALSLAMLVQTMLCDTYVGDLEYVWQ